MNFLAARPWTQQDVWNYPNNGGHSVGQKSHRRTQRLSFLLRLELNRFNSSTFISELQKWDGIKPDNICVFFLFENKAADRRYHPPRIVSGTNGKPGTRRQKVSVLKKTIAEAANGSALLAKYKPGEERLNWSRCQNSTCLPRSFFYIKKKKNVIPGV